MKNTMTLPKLDVFQVIADGNRRKMIHLLTENKLSINRLAENFEMSRPAVSKHIAILEQAGFIKIENVGRERYCAINEQGFEELRAWIAYYDDFWNRKLLKLQEVIRQKES